MFISSALQEGLTKIFIQAGAIVSTPTCGPCLGGHMGILAHGENGGLHHQPQLCRPYGSYHLGSLSGKPGCCRSKSAVAGYICAPDDLK